MVSRFISFLTDLIIFTFGYSFIFVSVLILFFDRNTDYDRFMIPFYVLMGITAYLYFILPLFFHGQTLGKKIFKISVESNKGAMNILKFHVKYIMLRLFPLLSIIFFLNTDSTVLKVFFGLFSVYPIIDMIFMSLKETMLTDVLLKIEMKTY